MCEQRPLNIITVVALWSHLSESHTARSSGYDTIDAYFASYFSLAFSFISIEARQGILNDSRKIIKCFQVSSSTSFYPLQMNDICEILYELSSILACCKPDPSTSDSAGFLSSAIHDNKFLTYKLSSNSLLWHPFSFRSVWGGSELWEKRTRIETSRIWRRTEPEG